MSRRQPPLTPEQEAARARWQQRFTLPLILAAVVPLFTTSSNGRLGIQILIGVGSWLIFLIDLHVQRKIVPDYLHRPLGKFDLTIVIMTFPYYLIPGLGNYTAFLLIARLARLARLFVATAGLRRFFQRIGKVALVALAVVLLGASVAYGAEHPTNPEFATVGDALWWGIVTLTTVGYGDVVPQTQTGRLAGIMIMVTGIAVLGVLSGSLASLFRVEEPEEKNGVPSNGEALPPAEGGGGAESEGAGGRDSLGDELAALRSELRLVEQRLGKLAERAR